jgi:hypothetical protein
VGSDAIGQFDDPRLLGRRTLHQADDRRQPGGLARPAVTWTSRGLSMLTAPPVTVRPGRLSDRRALAGQQRFIGAARPLEHLSVGRDGLAGPHQHDLARPQVGRQHLLDHRGCAG